MHSPKSYRCCLKPYRLSADGQAKRRPLLADPVPPPHKSVLYSACTVTERSFTYRDPVVSSVVNTGARAGPPPPPRGPPVPLQHAAHRPMQAKTKVISILDRARSALESSYPYEDPYGVAPEPPVSAH